MEGRLQRVVPLALAGILFGCTPSSTVATTSSTTTTTAATTTTSTTTSTTTTTTTLPPPAPLDEITLGTAEFASGFDWPILLTSRPGDSHLFVVEQVGLVKVLEDGEWHTVLDISRKVAFQGERGLLGLAFHPESPERMVVHYSRAGEGETVIEEYRVDGLVADPEPTRAILTFPQPAANHNGGMIAFGPDGYLYIAIGDGGGGNDTFRNGQNPFSLLGAILRIDVDGPAPYAIPPDNPFADGVSGAPEVWAWGLRNPWRFSFDGEDLWIGDVGQNVREEVDLITVHDGGVNLGWPIFEGFTCYLGSQAQCDDSSLAAPVYEYVHSDGRCSITGGYVYRGTVMPELAGTYLFGDYCTGEIFGLRVEDGVVTESARFGTPLPSLTSFGVGPDGEIYVTHGRGSVSIVYPVYGRHSSS